MKTFFTGFIIALFLSSQFLVASEPVSGNENSTLKEHEKFDPSSFMFGHISDAYDWHLLDIGKKSISIPLPVILFSKESGFHAFLSSKFEHGHATFKGFQIANEGDHKGKIIETLADGSEEVPFDVSITKNIAALLFSIALLLWMFLSVAKAYQRKPNHAPKGLQSWLEPVILFVRDDIAKPSIGAKHYERFMPYLLTVFFFILINNLLGLIPIPPGGANVTGNIAVTMVLALFTFVITTLRGSKSYWQHIFNTPGVPLWLKLPPMPIMPLVETIGVFTKPFILMVRLFANITAGHIIAMGFLSLIFIFKEMSEPLAYGVSVVSIGFIVFMSFLELLVAFIQAYVFTFLSAIYFGMAVEEHH
ncbi:MAG: F0F1 ATP synthase subunit A [Bacteroidota bacterium]|nr:MAG: F0F1 ATP synthase subunit A [Bacteroidota bacterium]